MIVCVLTTRALSNHKTHMILQQASYHVKHHYPTCMDIAGCILAIMQAGPDTRVPRQPWARPNTLSPTASRPLSPPPSSSSSPGREDVTTGSTLGDLEVVLLSC
jgi:hypothetical protein